MIYHKYYIRPTTTFKEELGDIIYYIKQKLKEPSIAKKFYKSVINEIKSLEILPERNKKINEIYDKTRNLRKASVKNYIIIYEISNNTRTSFYSTYFSQYTKLSIQIIIK